MTSLDQVRNNDATVHGIMKSGGSLSDCVVALANQKQDMLDRITELESIAPKAIRLPDGGVMIWRCPDHLIPVPTN
jgi:hypothetical protein